jgi:hypothetical protein
MFGDVEVQNTPPVVTDDEEAIEYAESDRWDREEIHRSDGFPMVPQKHESSFGRFGISRRSAHPAGDCSLADIEAKHEKLTMDAWRPPRGVLGDHAEYQISDLLREPFPACGFSNSGDQSPVESEARPVPPDDCLRRDNNQRILPLGPDPPRSHPKQFVEAIQSRPRMPTPEYGELLSQSEIFEKETTMSAKQTGNCTQKESKDGEHPSDITES